MYLESGVWCIVLLCFPNRNPISITTPLHRPHTCVYFVSAVLQTNIAHWDHSMGDMLQVNSMAVFLSHLARFLMSIANPAILARSRKLGNR